MSLKPLSESLANRLNSKPRSPKKLTVPVVPPTPVDRSLDTTIQMDLSSVMEASSPRVAAPSIAGLAQQADELLDCCAKRNGSNDAELVTRLEACLRRFRGCVLLQKLETRLMAQSSEEARTRAQVETMLARRELEKVRASPKRADRSQASKKALKYKVKYSQLKQVLAQKEAEIRRLKALNKTLPRLFGYQHTFQVHKAPQGSRESSDVSPDHSIMSQSPEDSRKPLDTLSMLASQAVLSFDRKSGYKAASLPPFPGNKQPETRPRLPGIGHLLGMRESDSDGESHLNSNDTIDEESTF